jgi:hypothetical protein
MSNTPSQTTDAEASATDTSDPVAQLAELNAKLDAANQRIGELTSENEKFTAAKEQLAGDEEIIRFKMSMGLSREQSVAVIRRQREAHRRDPDKALSPEASHQQYLRKHQRHGA